VINQNFLFGILFILGGFSAGAFGYLTPIIAALLHNVGSLMVVFNSARLVRQGEELDPFLGAAAAADTASPNSATPANLAPRPA
jgi:hypothetical protein